MTEITLTFIKIAFLAVLWLFVIAAVGVIRADLFGSKAAERAANRPPRQPRQRANARSPRNAESPSAPPRGQQSSPSAPVPQQQQQSAAPTTLMVTEGPLQGTTIDLATSGPITIGRAPESTLVVVDDYASSRHARIYNQQGVWILEDLRSTNGTILGRVKVTQPTQLPVGIPVRIGKTVIELR
ncbi:antibiotic biosynthesis regulator FhaB [Actinocorallia lasiicapitis]